VPDAPPALSRRVVVFCLEQYPPVRRYRSGIPRCPPKEQTTREKGSDSPGACASGLDTSRERVPTEITWHLTSACSTNCQYCYLGRRPLSPEDLLPRRRMLELVDEAARIGIPTLRPAGGDVLLYPHLFDFLDAVSAHGMSPMRIATKAFVSPEIARRLAEYSLIHEVQFSIDSTVPDVADYLVQTPGFCARALRSIDNALNAGLRVTGKCVITPYNIATVPRLYRELRHQGVEMVRLATYSRSGYHHREGLFNHAEDYDWFDKQLDALRAEFPDDSIHYQNGRPYLVDKQYPEQRENSWRKRVRCTAGRTSMLICADGKVIPCEQLPEIEELFVGDVRHQSIEEVWNGKKLDEITIHFPRERYRGTVCYDCDEFSECHLEKGYCIRDTYIQYGTIWQAAPSCPRNDRFVRVM
jgi:radical SAM protein with 4Fe4S-binding SPASM domain